MSELRKKLSALRNALQEGARLVSGVELMAKHMEQDTHHLRDIARRLKKIKDDELR